MPASVGATAGASTMPKLSRPVARPCRLGGKRRITTTIDRGCWTPAAAPCSRRIATVNAKSLTSAPARLVRPRKNTVPKKTRRKPKRSSSQGVGSMARVIAAM